VEKEEGEEAKQGDKKGEEWGRRRGMRRKK
jgi:hypothetical protein